MKTLNQIFKWTTAILPFVLACAGIGALITGNIITARKDAKITTCETNAAPRMLNEGKINQIVAQLRPFGSRKYDLSVPTFQVDQGAIADNKRLGPRLAMIAMSSCVAGPSVVVGRAGAVSVRPISSRSAKPSTSRPS